MSISAISNQLREILKDIHNSTKDPSSCLYDIHLNALDCWHAELPLYVCLLTPSSDDSRMFRQEASYQQRTAIVRSQFPAWGSIYPCWSIWQVDRPISFPRHCLRATATRVDDRVTKSIIFKRGLFEIICSSMCSISHNLGTALRWDCSHYFPSVSLLDRTALPIQNNSDLDCRHEPKRLRLRGVHFAEGTPGVHPDRPEFAQPN